MGIDVKTFGSLKTFDERLEAWYEMKEKLNTLRNEEAAVRRALFAEAFPQGELEKTLSKPLGMGYKLVGKQGVTRSVDTAAVAAMCEEMKKIGQDIEPLLRWKAELNLKPYKALPENARQLFDHIITSKDDGLPELKIVPANDVEEPEEAPVETSAGKVEVKRMRKTKKEA